VSSHVEAIIVYRPEGCMAAVANAICNPPHNLKIAFVFVIASPWY